MISLNERPRVTIRLPRKKILLYYPPAALDESSTLFNFPLPMLSICSLLDQNKYEIIIESGFANSHKMLLDNIDNAICLGISVMTGVQIRHALEMAKKLRLACPEIPIILGGYHASTLPEQTLENPYVDIVVRGYGEMVFKELVDALESGDDLHTVDGISYSDKNKIYHNKDSVIPRMEELPPIPYHLIDVRNYITSDPFHSLPYISSRGCPHRCGFCSDFVIYKRKWNPRPAHIVVRELKELRQVYDPAVIRFVDSNLFVDEKRVVKICEGLLKENIRLNFIKVNGDAYIMSKYSEDTFRIMHEAGFNNVLIGVESGYPEALKCISKKASKDQVRTVLINLRKNNISVGHSLMLGFPYDLPKEQLENEHRKELIETMKFIYELSLHYVPGNYYLLFFFTPYPGTILFDRCIKLGFSPPTNLEGWADVNLNTAIAPWISNETASLINECHKINYFLAGKSERTWRIYQYYRFQRILPKKIYDKIITETSRRINSLVYKRLQDDMLHLPKIVDIWYGFERSFFYGRQGEQNFEIKEILKKVIYKLVIGILRKMKNMRVRITDIFR